MRRALSRPTAPPTGDRYVYAPAGCSRRPFPDGRTATIVRPEWGALACASLLTRRLSPRRGRLGRRLGRRTGVERGVQAAGRFMDVGPAAQGGGRPSRRRSCFSEPCYGFYVEPPDQATAPTAAKACASVCPLEVGRAHVRREGPCVHPRRDHEARECGALQVVWAAMCRAAGQDATRHQHAWASNARGHDVVLMRLAELAARPREAGRAGEPTGEPPQERLQFAETATT